MPELPEVETTCRGIEPQLTGRRIVRCTVRQRKLRMPVSRGLERRIQGSNILRVERRAKYLMIGTTNGTLLIHLGMTGSLRILGGQTPPGKHDHVDLWLDNGCGLRFNDPRRFGCVLWTTRNPLSHRLLKGLGPEPLESGFDGEYLHARSRDRKIAIKPFIMDGGIVVGVGNIYASEALFRAGIHPSRPAGRISRERMHRLATAIKDVLTDAIRAGGTTIRDFSGSAGQPGYFAQDLRVYDRAGDGCLSCDGIIRQRVLGQRASYYCPRCQR